MPRSFCLSPPPRRLSKCHPQSHPPPQRKRLGFCSPPLPPLSFLLPAHLGTKPSFVSGLVRISQDWSGSVSFFFLTKLPRAPPPLSFAISLESPVAAAMSRIECPSCARMLQAAICSSRDLNLTVWRSGPELLRAAAVLGVFPGASLCHHVLPCKSFY